MVGYIEEWEFSRIPGDLLITLCLLSFLATGGLLRSEIPLADRVLGLIWLILALSSRRHVPLLGLLGMPFLVQAMAHMMREQAQGAAWLARKDEEYRRDLTTLPRPRNSSRRRARADAGAGLPRHSSRDRG